MIDNDDELFRKIMQAEEVKPLKTQARVELKSKHSSGEIALKKREAASRAINTYGDERLSDHAQHVEGGEHLVHRRPGLQQQQFKKLRNGQIAPEAEIDLHGYRLEEARAALTVFLRRSQNRGIKCVRVIHGKGIQRPDVETTIKSAVISWLTQINSVMGFASCLPADGGTGAVYVLLKRSKMRADNAN